MATTTVRKPRTSVEAVPQLATLPERVAIVETKVHAIEEKIDDLKGDIKNMHDCLDNTRDLLADKLKEMSNESTAQHNELAGKIKELQTDKNKFMMYGLAGLAFLAGSDLIHAANFTQIIKFLGL